MGGSSSKIHTTNDLIDNDISNRSNSNELHNSIIGQEKAMKIDDKYINKLINSEKWELLIKLLNKNTEKLLEPRGNSNQLPIHIAISKGAPISFINELIEKCPESLLVSDKDGYLPIHKAIINRSHIDIIKKLLFYNSKALEISDNDGLISLHHSIIYKSNYDIFMLLLQSYDKSVECKSKYGKLPIHLAIEYHAPIEIVKTILEKYPLGIKEFNDARLPLHYVCEKKSSMEIFQLVLSYHPEAVNIKGYEGMLPIHFATGNRVSYDVIVQLVDLYRESVLVYDRTSRLPLHHALEKQASEEVITFLLDVAPNTASNQGPKGDRPLHIALQKNLSIKIIDIILSLDKYAPKEVDSYGLLPIQQVLTSANTSDDVVIAVLKAYPTASQISDEYLRLPIHYAASRKQSYDILKELIAIYPQSLLCGDQNNQLPLHLILKRNPTVEIIELLVNNCKDSVLFSDIYDYLPIFHAIENKACKLDIFKILLNSIDDINITIKCCKFRSKGKLLLHYAIIFQKPYDIIKLLVDIYPDSIIDREQQYGKLPICLAIEKQYNKDVLFILLSIDNISLCDDNGYLPIHYGIRYQVSIDIIKCMLKLYPTIVHIVDNPIHNKTNQSNSNLSSPSIGKSIEFKTVNVSSNNEYDDTFLLNESDDQHILHTSLIAYGKRKRELTGRLLLHFIIEDLIEHENLIISSDIIVEIALLTMPINHESGFINPNHHYTWTYLLSECNDKYIDVVESILKLYEYNILYIQYLSNFPNDQGYKALDISTPQCKFLLLKRLYYYGRYEIISKSRCTNINNKIDSNIDDQIDITHQSDFSIIQLAIDHEDTTTNLVKPTSNKSNSLVILKLIKSRDLFDHEINIRLNISLDSHYIVPITHYHDSDNDILYREETLNKGYKEFPYCIVMNAGDCDLLHIVIHEHLSNRQVISLFTDILQALDHLHSKGYIHGDLRPLNIIRENGRLKLIDLSNCISYLNNEIIGKQPYRKNQPISQYQPPELVNIVNLPNNSTTNRSTNRFSTIKFRKTTSITASIDDNHRGNNRLTLQSKLINTVINEEDSDDDNNNEIDSPIEYKANLSNPLSSQLDQLYDNTTITLIKADISIDMWALGCILYLLLTNEYLLPSRIDNDSIDSNYLPILKQWPNNYKIQKLIKIKDVCSYNLLNRLLSKDIHRRPTSISEILNHPYITNKPPIARFSEMEAEYDFYISYRWKQDMLTYLSNEQSRKSNKKKRRLSTVSIKSNTDSNIDTLNHTMYMYDDEKHSNRLKDLLVKRGFKVCKSSYHHDINDYDITIDEQYDHNLLYNAFNMMKSRTVIIVLSRYGINDCIDNSSLEKISNDSSIHQLLFEMRLAIELRNMGLLLSEIFVVLIGDVKDNHLDSKNCDNVRNNQMDTNTDNNDINLDSDQLVSVIDPQSNKSTKNDVNIVCDANKQIDISIDTDINKSFGNNINDETNSPVNENISPKNHIILPIQYKDSNNLNIDEVEYNMYYEEFDGIAVGRFGSCHPVSFPTISINKIESFLKYALSCNHLGLPSVRDMTVYDIVEDIISYGNYMIVGKGKEVFHNVIDDIIEKYYDTLYLSDQLKYNNIKDKSFMYQDHDLSRISPTNLSNLPNIHHNTRRKSQVLSASLSKQINYIDTNISDENLTDKERLLYDEIKSLHNELDKLKLQLNTIK